MSRHLPEFPNLDYLKKRAKILLRELQHRNPEAKLTQAQHAVAREYGFASWAKLKAYVRSLPPAAGSTAAEAMPPHGDAGGRATSGPIDPQAGGSDRLFPRFTEKARRMMFFARYFARQDNRRMAADDLLLGVVQADGQLMNRLLPGAFQPRPAPTVEEMARLKASLAERIPTLLDRMTRRTAGENVATTSESPLSMECRQVLEHAAREADRLQHQRISTGHVLLALLRDDAAESKPILRDVLKPSGMQLDAARDEIVRFLTEEGL